MATGTSVALRVAARLGDATQAELTAAQYLAFVNDAIDDLAGAGWLEPQTEDESLSLSASTYEYDVPAGFAYIRTIYVADSDGTYPADHEVPQHQYRLILDASADPEIHFLKDRFDLLISGRALKLIGQKRPTQDIAGGATIVSGMEAFIRERAIAYAGDALSAMAAAGDLAPYRAEIAKQAWAKSEQMLARHPQEFRVKPNSRHVPGR